MINNVDNGSIRAAPHISVARNSPTPTNTATYTTTAQPNQPYNNSTTGTTRTMPSVHTSQSNDSHNNNITMETKFQHVENLMMGFKTSFKPITMSANRDRNIHANHNHTNNNQNGSIETTTGHSASRQQGNYSAASIIDSTPSSLKVQTSFAQSGSTGSSASNHIDTYNPYPSYASTTTGTKSHPYEPWTYLPTGPAISRIHSDASNAPITVTSNTYAIGETTTPVPTTHRNPTGSNAGVLSASDFLLSLKKAQQQ